MATTCPHKQALYFLPPVESCETWEAFYQRTHSDFREVFEFYAKRQEVDPATTPHYITAVAEDETT